MRTELLYELFQKHPRVSTDSRDIPKGGIFFALKGPNFNGNNFAIEALSKGAALAVVDEGDYPEEPRCIRVPDSLAALQQLAAYHRKQCKATILALTGSNGKTTTKELIAAVLSLKYNTLATQGNLNNHIGVPLTLLRLQAETEMAVVEMGANHQGEIGFLCSIANPDYGYITNFGKAHLEGFGGIQGVIRGKSELYRHLKKTDGTIFINADDPIQAQSIQGYSHCSGFSTSDPQYNRIRNRTKGPHVRLEVEGVEIQTGLIGNYNFSNCAAAAHIGMYFQVPVPAIKKALEAYRPENNRSQVIRRGNLTIILDAYNANPTSMSAALDHLTALQASRKIAILGDMFELGDEAQAEHENIGNRALSSDLDKVYLVGKNFYDTGLSSLRFPNYESLAREMKSRPLQGPATVLIKGSRGMALERLLEII